MKKLLLVLLFVPFFNYGQNNVYSKSMKEVEQVAILIKNSYDDFKKYAGLVDWNEELNLSEITRAEYLKKSGKIDKLRSILEESIKNQDILMDSIVRIIELNIPIKEQAEILKTFESNLFLQTKLSRSPIEMQIMDLRMKLMSITMKN